MNEISYIGRCLQLIMDKMGWKDSSILVYEDFRILQEKIQEASGIRLSVHTLERLFGKLKTHENYNPQNETKKALAVFLGYNSWRNFKEQNPIDPENLQTGQKVTKRGFYSTPATKASAGTGNILNNFRLNKLFIIPLALITLIICGYFAFGIYNQKELTEANVELSATNLYGVRPHTVEFKFNLSELDAKNLSIDFGVGKPLNISKNQTQVFKTYLKPGIHTVQLKADGIPVASTKVFIDLEGWKGYTYRQYENVETQRSIPDSLLQTGSALHTPPQLLKNLIEPNTHYFVEYINIHNFDLMGDNMILETRFRNNDNFDYQLCYDMWIKVIGTDGVLKMHFLKSGCAGFVQMIFGEKFLDGHKQDLSAFTQEFHDWKKARMKVNDKDVSIYFEDKLIYTTSYTQPVGKIMGIAITSKGAAETDYIKLYSTEKELVYSEDF